MKDVQEYIPQNVSKNKVIPPVDAKTFVFNVTGQPPPQIAQHNLSFADQFAGLTLNDSKITKDAKVASPIPQPIDEEKLLNQQLETPAM